MNEKLESVPAFFLRVWRAPWTLTKLRDTVGGICLVLMCLAAVISLSCWAVGK
jgi:hypothetical protein